MGTKEVIIKAGSLVLLSGLPGAGKSSLKATARGFVDLDAAWLSMDDIRVSMLGASLDYDETSDTNYLDIPQSANPAVFSILKTIVRTRLQHGRTCIVDATWPTDSSRQGWAELAQELGVHFKVLILDTTLEECLDANRKRTCRVPERAIEEMYQPSGELGDGKGGQGFMLTSKFPFEIISREHVLVHEHPKLDGLNWDVVGDVHGLTNELLDLLAKAGWVFDNNRLSHPQGRKLLFLGDLVDRGYDSLGLLRIVRNAVKDGVAICLQGNHEEKVVRFWDKAKLEGVERWGSFANASTGVELLKADDGESLVHFMRGLPSYYLLETEDSLKFAFAHANLRRFDPGLTAKGDLLYGQSGHNRTLDLDAEYEQRYKVGLNEYTLIRGHIPQTSEQEHVFSLEKHCFQKGWLVLLQMDKMVNAIREGLSQKEAFKLSVLEQKCEYDFEKVSKRWTAIRELDGLTQNKKVMRQLDSSKMLRVYKYSKQTFWDNSWNESEWLLKARGIVFDTAGNIVSHPFDKVFNYRENGAGINLPSSHPIVAVEKLNGFLGICSSHPFQPGKLVFHTQGSFEGEFVDFITSLVTPQQQGQIKKFLHRNDVTLTFEVIHPEDPHIVEYDEKDHGLWLIGVRGKSLSDTVWTEEEIDRAASEMGLRRPRWEVTTVGNLLASCKSADGSLTKLEGWMARSTDERQTYYFKLKTPYYLVTKFMGRLSSKKIKHMYGNPMQFKQTIDEEFYGLVDILTQRISKDEMLELSDLERVAIVRKLVEEMF